MLHLLCLKVQTKAGVFCIAFRSFSTLEEHSQALERLTEERASMQELQPSFSCLHETEDFAYESGKVLLDLQRKVPDIQPRVSVTCRWGVTVAVGSWGAKEILLEDFGRLAEAYLWAFSLWSTGWREYTIQSTLWSWVVLAVYLSPADQTHSECRIVHRCDVSMQLEIYTSLVQRTMHLLVDIRLQLG